MLIEKVKVVEGLKDGEVGEKIKVYQDEILQVTNNFQMEIADLKKQIIAREKDLEYQKNTNILRDDKHLNELNH